MSRNPLNLLLRFALEMAALVALGRWGWGLLPGWRGVAPGLLTPALAAAAWGVFRVPDDGGAPTVTVTGRVRLALETAFFGGAVLALAATGAGEWATPMGVAVGLHYLLSWDRVGKLARNRPLAPSGAPQDDAPGRPV